MTGNAPTHTCSYFCDKPECIKAQRDELREKLAALDSQPVPVEPEIPTVYYVTIPTGEYASVVTTASLSKWRAYINTMQSALHRAQEERDKSCELLEALNEKSTALISVNERLKHRAEKAESLNRRMVELMKEATDELREYLDGPCALTKSRTDTDCGCVSCTVRKAMRPLINEATK